MLLIQAWDNQANAPVNWGSHIMILWNDFEPKQGIYNFDIINQALAKKDRPCYLQLGFSQYNKILGFPENYTPKFYGEDIILTTSSGKIGHIPSYSTVWTMAYNLAVQAMAHEFRDNTRVAGYWHSTGWNQETQAAVNNSGGNWADLLKPLLKQNTYLDFITLSTTLVQSSWNLKKIYLAGAPSPGNVWGNKSRNVIIDLLKNGCGYMNCGLGTDIGNAFGYDERLGQGLYEAAYDAPYNGFEEGRRYAEQEPLEVYWMLVHALHYKADFVNIYDSISGSDAQLISHLLPDNDNRWIVFRDKEFPSITFIGSNDLKYTFSGESGNWGNRLSCDYSNKLIFDSTRYDMGRWILYADEPIIINAPELIDGNYNIVTYKPNGLIEKKIVIVKNEQFTLPIGEYHRVDVGDKVQELLPEYEPIISVSLLADKCRWWLEESIRQDELGNVEYAKVIRYSLINLDTGLFYRLERALKSGSETG